MKPVKVDRPIIKGISVLNPDKINEEYFNKTIDYAIKKGYTHMQIIGPIHNFDYGNIDGMTASVKYAQFNNERHLDYIELNMRVVNAGLERLHNAGIKTYMWHHELDLPENFAKAFPEVLNENADMEVSHPLVQDYLENRIFDFFTAYPKMDGVILTLHETKIPLLRLQNQKLDKIQRVKYVTKILHDACKKMGKELIVRPFASLPDDYDMMLKAYEEVSKDMLVMDKWVQYDWSLVLPSNQFFAKIKNNPLFVETDMSGEYFGKLRLPIMFKEHIIEKFNYSEQFKPVGYVSRIDRDRLSTLGNVNEVNVEIMHACLNNLDVDEVVDEFFKREYPDCAAELKSIMQPTQEINRKLFQTDDYFYNQGSYFPTMQHTINHYLYEIVRKDYCLDSNEWYIPIGWKRTSVEFMLEEKDEVVNDSLALLQRVEKLQGKMESSKFDQLLKQFQNLYYTALCWRQLLITCISYVHYFENKTAEAEQAFYDSLEKLIAYDDKGRAVIGDIDFYHLNKGRFTGEGNHRIVEYFVNDCRESFIAEKKANERLEKEGLYDYVVCGGALEGHKLQKEVNFSEPKVFNGEKCRIPGNASGWSTINAHGWFSYEIAVKPNTENKIIFTVGSMTDKLEVKIAVGEQVSVIKENFDGVKDFEFIYYAKTEDKIRVRVDRVSPHTPLIYTVKVQ